MRIFIFTLFLLVSSSFVFSQTERKLVVLDLTNRNSESNNSRILSAMHVADIAGLSYDTTSNLNLALNYPVILFATRVQSSTFNSSEKQQIRDYVNTGGVAIISSLRDEDLFDVAGISNATSANNLFNCQVTSVIFH